MSRSLKFNMGKEGERAFTRFMRQSTFHGFSEIATATRRTERGFFVALIVVCYCLTFYGFYQTAVGYVNKPVVTTIVVEDHDVLDLPDVMVCLFNRLNDAYFREHNISQDIAMFLEWTFLWVNPTYDFAQYPTLESMWSFPDYLVQELDKLLEQKGMTVEQLIDAASFKCEDIFLECRHAYVPFNCCSETEGTQAVMTDMGRCFKFKSRSQDFPGFQNGLTVHMRIPVNNFSQSETMLLNDGIKVKMNEKGLGHEFDAIFSPMGVHTVLQLQATHLDFMNDPPRYRCDDQVTENYSLMTCFESCMLEPILSDCGCRYIAAHSVGNATAPVCKPGQIVNCAYPRLQQVLQVGTTGKSVKELRELECRRKCKPPCMYWKYSTTVTYAKLGAYLDDEAKASAATAVVLDVYFEKMDYTLLKHAPSMTVDNFIANIGGQVGLWMGGSILSIIHLVVFLVLYAGDKGHDKARLRIDRATTLKRNNLSIVSTAVETFDSKDPTDRNISAFLTPSRSASPDGGPTAKRRRPRSCSTGESEV